MARTPEQIVQAEVLCCMSSIVSTLASGYGAAIVHVDAYGRRSTNGSDLSNLIEQAFELAAPIEDYEEAARYEGWTLRPETVDENGIKSDACVVRGTSAGDAKHAVGFKYAEDWQEACESDGIEPYPREVFEHWAVTDWFADQLVAHGEKVDKDFAGLCIWARTTTGQAIASDYVLEQIAADLNRA